MMYMRQQDDIARTKLEETQPCGNKFSLRNRIRNLTRFVVLAHHRSAQRLVLPQAGTSKKSLGGKLRNK
ncbi:hypothetical protein, conserved [Eimeria tenella]|uniref:Uncharacterized protein n=1 Tax=Eimeria tenella TaxID=5802 RepID=U6L5P8_EIMTE|nr:hypothetical protein, conserved [Eimeria tenella]CDJ43120.1 hypothetical protein, conserved [Eimeria tenella]|eukprot:XP_013233870.1 hypothetical protein, conserved [Eimeria tenella]